jgi:signal transduction histidine kinase
MCTDTTPTFLGIFDLGVAPPLLFYSYIPIALTALLLGIFVYYNDKYSTRARLLFTLTALFAISIANEILLWISLPAAVVFFGWALVPLLRLMLIVTTIYFVYAFINKKPPSFGFNATVFALSLPVILLLPTKLNLTAFDVDYCEALSGPLISYVYALAAVGVLWFIYKGVRSIKGQFIDKAEKYTHISVLIASSLFMIFLSFSEFIAVYTSNYEINLVGPIGMMLFLVILSYLIVKFHVFNIKLLAAQALVAGLALLISSEYFFVSSLRNQILVTVTLILAIIGGYFLVKSVKKEIEQREQIAQLAETLAQANERLKILDKMKSEFVSIASHQLRSPLTTIRGYASMLEDGSYGKLPEKAQQAITNIADSSKYMAMSIEDYLNVSRIEAGNMKYEMSDFNLKDLAEKIVDEMRPAGLKKGLVMVFRSDCDGGCNIHADIGKTRQIIMNLIDNSMKYTPKGAITVVAHDDVKNKKIRVSIQDTGVGMSKETLEEVFDKFVRAKNANQVNVTGTGLGLFVAKKMTNEMKGKVWAESEGEGKGSTFHLEFPLIPSIASAR